MQVQVSTNSSVEGSEQLTSEIESTVRSTLSRFADQITRVEVHLVDETQLGKLDRRKGNQPMGGPEVP